MYVQKIMEAVDRIDETPFGKVGKLFDRMADDALSAINERKTLVEALDGVVLVCGRTGNAFEDFEEQAAAFQKDTGFMRPGKDMPTEGSGEDNREVRREKFNDWVKGKIEDARNALKQSAT